MNQQLNCGIESSDYPAGFPSKIVIDLPLDGTLFLQKRQSGAGATADANDPVFAAKSCSDTITTAHSTNDDGETAISQPMSIASSRWLSTSFRAIKRVRFEINDQNKVISHVLGTSRSQDMASAWWSPHEMATMHEHAYAVVSFFSHYRQDYTTAVRTLISGCAQSGASQHCLRTANMLPTIVSSSARGLEGCIVEILQSRRDRTRRLFLRKQEMLGSCNLEKRSHLLRMQYMHDTRYAALWAQILADCDALEVADGLSTNHSIILSQSCHHF